MRLIQLIATLSNCPGPHPKNVDKGKPFSDVKDVTEFNYGELKFDYYDINKTFSPFTLKETRQHMKGLKANQKAIFFSSVSTVTDFGSQIDFTFISGFPNGTNKIGYESLTLTVKSKSKENWNYRSIIDLRGKSVYNIYEINKILPKQSKNATIIIHSALEPVLQQKQPAPTGMIEAFRSLWISMHPKNAKAKIAPKNAPKKLSKK